MWLTEFYQSVKTARSVLLWSRLPIPLRPKVVRALFKLRLTRFSERKTSIKLLDYQIRFPGAGVLKELFREIFVNGIYIFYPAKDDPIILDCGSNIGRSILFFKMLYPKARITGFEPDPFTFDLLTDNVRSNSLADVELHQCALSDGDHSITLYRPSEEGASSMRMNVIGKRAVNSASITVQARRLSGFIRDHEIDLLKIDIEGAEHQVLREISDSGKIRRIKRIHLEYHHHLESDRYNLASILCLLEANDFGYQIRANGPAWPSEGVFQDMLI